ncbi:hypothetical protein DACRYDRAFT_18089 [Dacryopinax primogenitus]|uniref:Alpha-type protein kinase domain-containing protein n=1 Tax=Dacryopinax primogenitus (strain DJM 731) TaxID=1858805 RepID=M5FPD8_DACPD|nr:uncharacterized protein DACRYDRAFT_18089 [Dacryopinax primogenitus]EJT98470.1 hypothetical protein DACRYDRAFT_18089 [Dacryopinax primogenitus]
MHEYHTDLTTEALLVEDIWAALLQSMVEIESAVLAAYADVYQEMGQFLPVPVLGFNDLVKNWETFMLEWREGSYQGGIIVDEQRNHELGKPGSLKMVHPGKMVLYKEVKEWDRCNAKPFSLGVQTRAAFKRWSVKWPLVRFVMAGLFWVTQPCQTKDGSKKGRLHVHYLVEELLDGVLDFRQEGQLAQFLCFSQHLQYMEMRGMVFVSDYQGVGSLLTDLQIMTNLMLKEKIGGGEKGKIEGGLDWNVVEICIMDAQKEV